MRPRAPAAAAALALALLAAPASSVRDEDAAASLSEDLTSVEVRSLEASSALGNRSAAGWVWDGDCIDAVKIDMRMEMSDMAGQKATQEENQYHCQRRCKVTVGCTHFVWVDQSRDGLTGHTRIGDCYLRKTVPAAGEAHIHYAHSAFTGPQDCSHRRASCYNLNMAYDKDLADKGEGRTEEKTPLDCLERCRGIADCKYYSWYQDGGCHVHPSGANARWSRDVISAPAGCAECFEAQKFRRGADMDKAVLLATQELCQQYCLSWIRADFFSFWSDGKCSCHGKASRTKAGKLVLTGPTSCSAASQQ